MARSRQLDRLTKKLEAIPERVREAVAPSLQKSGNELVGTMKTLAPEDTGDLKRSLTVTPGGQATPPYSQPGGSQVVPVGAVAVTAGNAEVRYPHLVEYGTVEAPAQAFFWPSFRLLRKRITNRTKRDLRKAVREGWQS
ncbi:HK97-gp10 family putative phage morphogenesis protein [Methylobacterium oryzisoli]|uniref:HK97-gp10 family putative phage morphogenesis protein n=1 Tax=Methylobacterium oryzisoli TaxID=3385502 RepID=UPI00397CC54A